MLIRTPGFFKSLYPEAIWSCPSEKPNEKKVYLTFDDGPTFGVTQWVLDVLKSKNLKATFFCVGKNIEQEPFLFKSIQEQQHSIGNHTYNHVNGWKVKKQEYLRDIEKFESVYPTKLFRPHYGRIRISQFNQVKKKYKVVFWDILSYDYRQNLSVDLAFKHIVNNVRDGSVIVFHDSEKAEKNLKQLLPRTIDYLIAEGYEFATL